MDVQSFRGEARVCLVRLARRQAVAFGPDFTLEETWNTVNRLARERKSTHNVGGASTQYLEKVRRVESASLGRPRSRDAHDAPYLAAALSAHAMIVTYDKDLLDLGKPFGSNAMKPTLAIF